jgi:hypothetical protein
MQQRNGTPALVTSDYKSGGIAGTISLAIILEIHMQGLHFKKNRLQMLPFSAKPYRGDKNRLFWVRTIWRLDLCVKKKEWSIRARQLKKY